MTSPNHDAMISKKLIQPDEALWALRDTNTTAAVRSHSGSVYYNDYRKRWISIRSEVMGQASFLGEIWYFEGDTPLGPWVYGQKIVTHRMGDSALDKLTWSRENAETYSFYNPLHHPEFDKQGGRIIYFEGTYTATFSGTHTVKTPGYNYNQIMYRLDLADPRLFVPVAVYRCKTGKGTCYRTKSDIPDDVSASKVGFFAPDRQRVGTVPVFEIRDGKGGASRLSLSAPKDGSASVAFYAVPTDAPADGSPVKPLYEYKTPDGTYRYATVDTDIPDGHVRAPEPLCRVWPNPLRLDWME
jgi:hypothetical protein